MNYVGIDVSKDDFHADTGDGRAVKFSNDDAGIAGLLSRLSSLGFVPGETVIGMEATGVYHLLLAERASAAGWLTKVMNPLQVSRLGKMAIRQVKNDRKDATLVRQAAAASSISGCAADDGETLRLKALVQERESLVKLRATCRQLGHVRAVRAASLEGGSGQDGFKAVEKVVSSQIKRLETDMAGVKPDVQKILRSIPGIGPACAAALAARVGDISRFTSPEKLVAYVGLDCRVHESGTSIKGKGYITKRGDRLLRHLLFLAANVSRRYIPELGAYYAKRRSAGKHHFSALCAIERKLVHVIWAVWTRGTPYERRSVPIKQAKTA
jgi:transposase